MNMHCLPAWERSLCMKTLQTEDARIASSSPDLLNNSVSEMVSSSWCKSHQVPKLTLLTWSARGDTQQRPRLPGSPGGRGHGLDMGLTAEVEGPRAWSPHCSNSQGKRLHLGSTCVMGLGSLSDSPGPWINFNKEALLNTGQDHGWLARTILETGDAHSMAWIDW